MSKIEIIADYRNLRKGDVLDIADVGEGVTQIYEQRKIAVRLKDDEALPEVLDRRVPGPREGRSNERNRTH